jgi:hypothetical protein
MKRLISLQFVSNSEGPFAPSFYAPSRRFPLGLVSFGECGADPNGNRFRSASSPASRPHPLQEHPAA